MTGRRWARQGTKALHDIAGMGFGGALAACLVINLTADRTSPEAFAAARQAFTAIAQYLLLPSMAIVVVSGLVAMIATRAYLNAGWAWVKALLGLLVLQATLLMVGASRELAATADAAALGALLRAERNTLCVLLALGVVNVVLAVWRPRLTVQVR